MAFQPVPDVALLRIEGAMDRQMTINDISFEISGGGITEFNLFTITLAMSDWVTSNLAPLLSRDWAAVRVIGIDETTATGPTVEIPNTTVGGVDQEAAPNNVAACVSFRTAFRGRSARGRNYVPGIPNSLITLNTLDAGFISDLLAAYAVLVGAGSFVAGWQFGIVSRVTGGVPRANGLFIPCNAVTMVGNSVRSMRSREIGHGA